MKLACNCGHVRELSIDQARSLIDLDQPLTCRDCGASKKLPPSCVPPTAPPWTPPRSAGRESGFAGAVVGVLTLVVGVMVVGSILSYRVPGTVEQVRANLPALPAMPAIAAPVQKQAKAGEWPRLLYTFRGVDSGETVPFDVADDWELRWDCRQQPVDIRIGEPGAEDVKYDIWMSGGLPTKGDSSFPKGGKFTARFRGKGPWKIGVWQNKNRID